MTGTEVCYVCGKDAPFMCETCERPICEDHESNEFEDVEHCSEHAPCLDVGLRYFDY